MSKILNKQEVINGMAEGEPIFEVGSEGEKPSYYMGKDINSVRIDTAQNLIKKYSLVREHVVGILYSWTCPMD